MVATRIIAEAVSVLHGFTIGGAGRGLVWRGLVRNFLVHRITWSVNSICHFFARRRFDTNDRSTNVAWLSLLSLGESWHHNDHAFPRSAFHGLRWWGIDPSGLIISVLERLGLAWQVVRISPERQRPARNSQPSPCGSKGPEKCRHRGSTWTLWRPARPRVRMTEP